MEKDIINQIKELTAENYSIEAYILGAKYLKHKQLEKIFKAIKTIETIEGYLPHNISDYRYEQYKKMMEYAKETLSPEEYEKFYMAF